MTSTVALNIRCSRNGLGTTAWASAGTVRTNFLKEVLRPGKDLIPGVHLTEKTEVVGPKTRFSGHDICLKELDVGALDAPGGTDGQR